MKKLAVNIFLVLLLVLAFAAVTLAKDPKAISTPDAPAAIGPYSQGIKYGELVFTSGQIPLTPGGVLVNTDITAATHQVMQNLQAILQEANMDFDNVLMTTVYLKDLNDSATFNTVYASYFAGSDHPPARATIQAGAIPKGALLEVSMIAGK